MSASRRLLPVVPLPDGCLFPGCSLEISELSPHAWRAVEIGQRTGGEVVVVAQRGADGRELEDVGTVAAITSLHQGDDATTLEMDGLRRARVFGVMGVEAQVAEVEEMAEGDAGDAWGSAVEAVARFVHAHPKLREFLNARRRSADPMAWVNLVCQHLPIKLATRQQLLEASPVDRCNRIGRVLDALLQKEQGG
jgi:Lon protease-like protein